MNRIAAFDPGTTLLKQLPCTMWRQVTRLEPGLWHPPPQLDKIKAAYLVRKESPGALYGDRIIKIVAPPD